MKRTQLLRRSRLKARGPRTKKSGGHLFPKGVDEAYRAWIVTLPCLLAGAVYGQALTLNDVSLGLAWRGFEHRCWGGMTPAHVGKHQATGAPDAERLVPLCAAAHVFYDTQRAAWAQITGWTEAKMHARAKALYAVYLAYRAYGAAPVSRGSP